VKIFTHPQETWSEAECEKWTKKANRDGMGTVGGPRGLINCDSAPYPRYGQARIYNGGCIRGDEWYNGEAVPLPVIPATYEFTKISSWGTVITRKESDENKGTKLLKFKKCKDK